MERNGKEKKKRMKSVKQTERPMDGNERETKTAREREIESRK